MVIKNRISFVCGIYGNYWYSKRRHTQAVTGLFQYSEYRSYYLIHIIYSIKLFQSRSATAPLDLPIHGRYSMVRLDPRHTNYSN